jgi:hypothetical protein
VVATRTFAEQEQLRLADGRPEGLLGVLARPLLLGVSVVGAWSGPATSNSSARAGVAAPMVTAAARPRTNHPRVMRPLGRQRSTWRLTFSTMIPSGGRLVGITRLVSLIRSAPRRRITVRDATFVSSA